MAEKRDFPITRNFRLHEFEVSSAHPELVEPVPDTQLTRIIELAVTVLQPLRGALGPTHILSGYRPEPLNSAVGGSPTSQHMSGEAADIRVAAYAPLEVLRAIRRMRLPVGQVISYNNDGFVHVALPSGRYPTPAWFRVSAGGLERIA